MTGLDPALLIAGDFIVLRMALVDELGGNIEAAIVLQRIAWRCEREGQWVATHADIQAETRLSERKVKDALAELRRRGYVTSERASSWDPTQAWTVVLDRPSPDGQNVRHVEAATSVTVTDVLSVTSLEDSETTTKTKNTPRRSSAAVSADLGLFAEAFDAWWLAYPRREGKGDARKAYLKATAKASTDELLAGAVRLAAHHQSARTEARFIPMPTTWLNQERWADTLTPASAAQRLAATQAEAAAVDRTAGRDHWAQGGGW